ncbi:MAG: HU family DNA-binding protein [Planctomycetia bacterium]|nr:HU family DNA-binding protein [Planctomycetia bacterium]
MTKKDVVKVVSEQIKCSQTLVKEVVQHTLDAFIKVLADEGRLELRNFGVFEVKQRKARMARNPKTGEKVATKSRRVVVFKPGKNMGDKMNSSCPD